MTDDSIWHIGLDEGVMKYDIRGAAYKVLAVRTLKNDSTEAKLSFIAVTRLPEKNEYVVNSGVELDTSGLKVIAYYNDDTTKDVTENITIDTEGTFDLSTIGTEQITISYSEGDIERTTKFPSSTFYRKWHKAI